MSKSRITNHESRSRIGSVPYLNAEPLIYGIEDRVSLHAPSQLADLLRDGKLDAGLVPIVECLAHDRYVVLEGASISCRGPVYSVILAHRGPIAQARKIFVDQASRSSILLLQVLLRERFGVTPELSPLPSYDFQNPPDTLLLIGDPAIKFRVLRSDYQLLDLGQAWWELTGLPFVFAAWAVRPWAIQPNLLSMLLQARRDGQQHIEEIARRRGEFTESFRREYLTRHVCFELGAEEKKGIAAFRELLQKSKQIQHVHDVRYVTG
jgi:predicted solute-binding protein